MNNQYEQLQNLKYDIYIYGDGEIAELTRNRLEALNVSIQGNVVDDEYVSGDSISKSKLINSSKEYVLIRGMKKCFFEKDEDIIEAWPGCKGVYYCGDIYEYKYEQIQSISEKFYLDNRTSFEWVKEQLGDLLSRNSLQAYIEAKIENDNMKLIPYIVSPQYFFKDAPFILNKEECLVDCGAYNGDSIQDFVRVTHNEYSYIYAFEPEKNNVEILRKNIQKSKIEKISIVEKACSNKKGVLRFSEGGEAGLVSENGEIEIEADTIDNVVNENRRITIIKMDVEGSEVDAILGAKHTIIKDRPILMISVYHKRDDVYNVYNTIANIVSGYKFYIRVHKVFAVDVVLYAVPQERVCK